MKMKTHLMTFEQILDRFECDCTAMSVGLMASGLLGRSGPQETEILSEKFAGTWWEVQLDSQNVPSHCVYVADSLLDALRLRPDIDISFWSAWHSSVACFVSDMDSWNEQQYYVW
jgi:hypothetical protein